MLGAEVLVVLARRVVALVLVLLAISILVFGLLYLAPGSRIDVLAGNRQIRSEAVTDTLNERYHLNDPIWSQYLHWLSDAVRFDFGDSIAKRAPVTSVIGESLKVTLPMAILAFLVTTVGGVTMGIVSALRKQRALDRVTVGASIIGVSAPVFATGMFLLYIFGVVLKWFPVYGTGSGGLDRLYHLVLPAIALSLTGTAFVVKLTRASMIAALSQDYIVFARARGIARTRVVLTYALRNAMVTVITMAGIVLGGLLTGTVVIEVTFGLPGLGSLLVESVNQKDIPVVQAVALLAGTLIVAANLVADVAYVVIDPRIRANPRS